MLGDANKENSIPATSDAKLNAKKNYSERNNTLKKYKISISVVQMIQSTLVCFKIHIMGKNICIFWSPASIISMSQKNYQGKNQD